jgi:peptidylprolyl isomerase
MLRRLVAVVVVAAALGGCRLKEEEAPMPVIAAPPDVAAAPADASVTASGLASKVLQPGNSNVRPTATSTVRVHYTGWTTNGEMFDRSVARGEPYETNLDSVIAGWTQGVQLMVVGERRRFWIPAKLAYGDTNPNPQLPTGTLVFDIELLGVR